MDYPELIPPNGTLLSVLTTSICRLFCPRYALKSWIASMHITDLHMMQGVYPKLVMRMIRFKKMKILFRTDLPKCLCRPGVPKITRIPPKVFIPGFRYENLFGYEDHICRFS